MDSDLALNQSYTYKIKALRTNEALYSNTITETLEPLATPNVKMEANTSYLHLSWDSIQKAKYYEIYRSTSPTMGFTRIAVIENYYTFIQIASITLVNQIKHIIIKSELDEPLTIRQIMEHSVRLSVAICTWQSHP